MTQEQDLSSLLDASIGDLAELPENVSFPAGAHRCNFDYEVKQLGENKTSMFCVKLKLVETLELNKPEEDTAPAVGSETQVMYNMANEFGQGALRALAKLFCTHLGIDPGTATLNQAFSPFKGGQLVFVTKVRENKKNKDEKYTDIVTVLFD